MSESMQGLHRTHRCTEVSNARILEKPLPSWDGYRKEEI